MTGQFYPLSTRINRVDSTHVDPIYSWTLDHLRSQPNTDV